MANYEADISLMMTSRQYAARASEKLSAELPTAGTAASAPGGRAEKLHERFIRCCMVGPCAATTAATGVRLPQ